MTAVQSIRSSEDRACRFRRIAGSGFRLAFELTRRCDLSCEHCFVLKGRDDPTTTEITDIIQQARQLDCQKLIITGGEPLLRGDLEQIISAATAQGMLADLNSNLYSLTRARVNALKAAGLQEVSTSLYGSESIHDELTGRKGSYRRVLEGIGLLREAGITVDVHGAIFDDMLPHIETLVETVQERGVSSLTFFSLLPAEGTGSVDSRTLSPDKAYETILKLRESFSLPIRTIGLRPLEEAECVMGEGIYGVGADMCLKPCLLSRPAHNEGIDLREQSLKQAISLLDQQRTCGQWSPACNPLGEGSKHAKR